MSEYPITMYDVNDIKNIFKLGENRAYDLMNSNGFPSIKIGKKILVEKSSLEKWISSQASM